MLTLSEKKNRLLQLIVRDGILYRTDTQPILSRDGTTGRWMLDSLCVSLTSEGLQLAAACLLELLQKFEGRQIATYGTTAIPLLTACVMQSNGRYEGLLVRKERKAHGSLKLIEGRLNKNEPVILLDDSVSSGISMQKCRDVLEAEGFRVEGGICLVRFDWYGGFALMQEQGYHMETLFDVDRDLVPLMPNEDKPLLNPTKQFPAITPWHDYAAAEGLSPTALARQVLTDYCQTGKLLRPPVALDQTYPHQGGCFISVRDRDNVYIRHARDGFWHFPSERVFSAAEDVVLASWQVARRLPQGEAGLAVLANSGLAVTFFSQLEACQVGDLDNDRYGIVVRSNERPQKMGGALPRMPGIATAGQQFQFAYKNNAALVSFEPHTLYRHDVLKLVEADAAWQASGVAKNPTQLAWFESPVLAQQITRRARDYLIAHITQQPVQGNPLPTTLCPQLDSLYVAVLLHGKLLGCMGKQVGDLERDLALLAEAVLSDDRFSNPLTAENLPDMVVKVSLLHSPLELGAYEPHEVMTPVRFCEQALMAHQGERDGILLPDVPVTFNLDEKAYVTEVLEKAGITQAPYAWRRYECSSWLDDGKTVRYLAKGFPQPEAIAGGIRQHLPVLRDKWAAYIQRQQLDDGTLYFYYLPFANQLMGVQDNVRTAHAAWVLARAQQRGLSSVNAESVEGLLRHLRGFVQRDGERCWLAETSNPAEHKYDTLAGAALLLLALCAQESISVEDAVLVTELAATLWTAIGTHGRIQCYVFPDKSYPEEANQDYVPGQVLLALASACAKGLTKCDYARANLALRYYWQRFNYKRRADPVSWLTQAWCAWWHFTQREALAEQCFVMADWIGQFQSKADGGFTTWQQSDGRADYMSAVYLEAVAAVLPIAAQQDASVRYLQYREACLRGFTFLDSLTVQARDQAVLPHLAWADGGVRQSPVNSTIRVDFVQHALSAAVYFDIDTRS